ncbi:helix-turn-helix transcriptional regulator [Aureimonas pseudogalii]|uniref:Putative DNA-binding transcriptional regulator YafY n=1 Tax=Aureimonas pseudogalii TaxID=1744844 RepID=A0A7W6H409_9HYPH|nr:YafY family protein [Aureimonas pseudogalii]MBB3997458.1 putative DNA-binding transcriptional regulator YafY [Aureimonas pseudogalii]
MSRAARLLDLVEILRRHRRPVSGAALAAETGVSLRTLRRDIAVLQGQGVPVEGEAGVGYVLRPGLTLPPLMLDEDEIDALVLGLRFVARRLEDELGAAAAGVLAKIEAVLPQGRSTEGVGLAVGHRRGEGHPCLPAIREAIHREEVLSIRYVDKTGAATHRAVWPVLVGFFEAAEVLAAWCELRRDFRHFRLDRIAEAEPAGRRMGRRHRVLLADWRLSQDWEGDGW